MKTPKTGFLFLWFLTLLFLNSSMVFAQTSSKAALEGIIKEALDNNPKIHGAYHHWKASEYKSSQVKSLPNPTLNYGYFGESVETRVGPQKQTFGISQQVPFPGKLKVKGEVYEKESEMLKQEYASMKNEIIKDVKFSFYDLYWLDRALEISNEEKSLLQDLEQVAQRKYEANLAPQQNVLKLQVELSKIIEKIALMKQKRAALQAKLNRLMHRKLTIPIDTVGEITPQDFSYNLEEILIQSQGVRQELVEANLNIEKLELETSLARKEYLPDFTLGYEYIDIGRGTTSSMDDGKDAWIGKLAVSLPIWFGKIKNGIKQKEQELQAAIQSQKDIEDGVAYEVQDVYLKILTYKDILSLYKTALVPQAKQAFEASQTGFETGAVSFLDWLDTQRTYLQTRLAYYKSITDYEQAIASLEHAIGVQLGGDNEE